MPIPRPEPKPAHDPIALALDRRADHLAEKNHAALLVHQGRFPGALLEVKPSHIRLWTGLQSGFFNAVARASWSPEVAPVAVRTIAEDLSARRVPWRWYLGSASTGEDLAPLIRAVHMMPIPSQTPMLLEPTERSMDRMVAAARPVPGLEVAEVRDPLALRDWVLVRAVSGDWLERVAEAWLAMHRALGLGPREPLVHLVGHLRGRPVASASVWLDDDGTAGIYHVDVVPDARERGIATWIASAAVALAFDRGADRIVLSSTHAALGLYRRLGFVALGSFTYFIDPRLGP